MNHSTYSIEDLAKRISDIEQVYVSLPGFYGNYPLQRQMMMDCLLEVNRAFESAGYDGITFATDLGLALSLTNEGRRIGLLALPRELRNSNPRHPVIRYFIEASSAALLEMSSADSSRTQLEWANQIAHALGHAGYERPGRGGRYTGSAIKKWRKDCIQRRHPFFSTYDETLAMFRDVCGNDVGGALKSWATVSAKRLGKKDRIGPDEALSVKKRALKVLFGASLGDDATINDVDQALNRLREDMHKAHSRRKRLVKGKGKLGG